MINLIHGDCLEKMKDIPDNSIDLTVTSPPYDDMRSYESTLEWNFNIFKDISNELYRITKDGGVLVWIVGDATINGSETGTSFKHALYFKEIGFNLHDTMIYEKAQSCFGSNKCYLQSFEYMFILSKGKPKTINFIRDRKNKVTGIQKMSKTALSKDGEKSERIEKELKEYGKRKNIWKYGVGGGKIAHPAIFPEKLAEDHIISWSNEEDIIFDPFMGSGTTGKMAILNNRNFIGIEKVEEYFNIAKERIETQLKMDELFE